MQNQWIATYTTTLSHLVPKVLTVSGNEKDTPPPNHVVLSVSTNCTKCLDWIKSRHHPFLLQFKPKGCAF